MISIDEVKEKYGEASLSSIRRDILRQAEQIVCSDRNEQYGEPEDNFAQIASFWSCYLGRDITAHDVAVMMALFKIGRISAQIVFKDDSYIDCAGYIACAAECAHKAK